MSQEFDVFLVVTGYKPDRELAIKTSADEDYTWEWDTCSPSCPEILGSFRASLPNEEEFARKITQSIWSANGAFCRVRIETFYVDDEDPDNDADAECSEQFDFSNEYT